MDRVSKNQPRKSNFCKNEKNAWRYHHPSFSTSVQKFMIICYNVPEIRIKFLFSIWGYFFTFYPPNNPKTQNLKK